MGSESVPTLPVINFPIENLKPGTNSWFSTRDDVRIALEKHGCFIAVYDKFPLEINNTILAASKELFNLPIETKTQNTSTKPFHGYGHHPNTNPLHQRMGIDDATNLEKAQSFTNLMWPTGNESFCESAHSYANMVEEMVKMVTRMVFESYGMEKYYDSQVSSFNYLLHFLKYRVPKMNETDVGLVPHKDKTFITILHQLNLVHGLEIKTKDDNWIRYEPSPSCFLVLAGEAFRAWSNCRIYAPLHRVIMSVKEERYSLGVLVFSNGMVETPAELVDDEHPLKFKPFDHIGLLHFLNSAEGRKALGRIEAYCGV